MNREELQRLADEVSTLNEENCRSWRALEAQSTAAAEKRRLRAEIEDNVRKITELLRRRDVLLGHSVGKPAR